jgi:putative transcriptional regulator
MKKFNLANHLLIATLQQEDGPFMQGVVYVCQHDEDGAMGILLNQPLGQTKFKDILTHMKINTHQDDRAEPIILAGGPIKPDHGFVVHSPIGQWKASMTVTSDIAITTSKDILLAMTAGGGNPPQKAFIALGYAGWSPGQLEEELLDNDWLAIPASDALVFDTDPKQLWKKAMNVSGVKNLATLAHFAGHA